MNLLSSYDPKTNKTTIRLEATDDRPITGDVAATPEGVEMAIHLPTTTLTAGLSRDEAHKLGAALMSAAHSKPEKTEAAGK